MTAAADDTDHTVRDEVMLVVWAHGQQHPDIGYFYPPDEIKYHGQNRGALSVNLLGTCAAL